MAGVVPNTLSAMRTAFGSCPQDILACLGPAIGPCCYEVGPDLIASVEQASDGVEELLLSQPNGRVHFDLVSGVGKQLRQAGVDQIETSALCTCCRTDEFFSHRGEKGQAGRFAAVLSLRE
jgi:copper oxidase (laccase) domain-containing protein